MYLSLNYHYNYRRNSRTNQFDSYQVLCGSTLDAQVLDSSYYHWIDTATFELIIMIILVKYVIVIIGGHRKCYEEVYRPWHYRIGEGTTSQEGESRDREEASSTVRDRRNVPHPYSLCNHRKCSFGAMQTMTRKTCSPWQNNERNGHWVLLNHSCKDVGIHCLRCTNPQIWPSMGIHQISPPLVRNMYLTRGGEFGWRVPNFSAPPARILGYLYRVYAYKTSFLSFLAPQAKIFSFRTSFYSDYSTKNDVFQRQAETLISKIFLIPRHVPN